MSCPVWLHDKLRKHFFRLEDGQITHCYRLEHEVHDVGDQYNRWWQVPVPQWRWAQRQHLRLVPKGCEIEYQLHLLEWAELPPAGWLMKRDDTSHPRHKQWSELKLLEQPLEHWIKLKLLEQPPEHWNGQKHQPPFVDFVPFPNLPKKHGPSYYGLAQRIIAP